MNDEEIQALFAIVSEYMVAANKHIDELYSEIDNLRTKFHLLDQDLDIVWEDLDAIAVQADGPALRMFIGGKEVGNAAAEQANELRPRGATECAPIAGHPSL